MRHARGLPAGLLLTGVLLLPQIASSQLPPRSQDPVSRRQMVSPKLLHSEPLVPLAEAGREAPAGALEAWRKFVAESQTEWGAYVDRRSGEIAAVSGGGLPWLDRGEKGDLD